MIAIRKTAFDGMTTSAKSSLSGAVARVRLGTPAIYVGDSQQWYVWDDHRLGDGSEWVEQMPKPVEVNSRVLDGIPDGWVPAPS